MHRVVLTAVFFRKERSGGEFRRSLEKCVDGSINTFDRGNFDLTERRLSHESNCVRQALEMEGRLLWR